MIPRGGADAPCSRHATAGRRRSQTPPVVRGGLPFVGPTLAYARDPRAFLRRCQASHGDIFTVPMLGRRLTFVCDPREFPAVLRCPDLEFGPLVDEILERAFGCPTVSKRIDCPRVEAVGRTRLRGPALATLSDAMTAALHRSVRAEFSRVAGSGELDLFALVRRCIFSAGTETVFGGGLSAPVLGRAFSHFDRQLPGLVAGIPRWWLRSGAQGLDRLAHALARLGPDASEWIAARHTLFAHLAPLERGRLQAAALWAVHANTIPTAFWTLAYLLCDRSALTGVMDELRRGPEEGKPRGSRVGILDSAVREALRLQSGALTVRRARRATTLRLRTHNVSIREGDDVALPPLLTHVDPRIFAEPDRFVVDRFVDRAAPTLDGQRVGLAFAPFGAGVHTCPGRFFAVHQVKAFVGAVLRGYHLVPSSPIPHADPRRAGLGVFLPRGDMRVRWQRRVRPLVGLSFPTAGG